MTVTMSKLKEWFVTGLVVLGFLLFAQMMNDDKPGDYDRAPHLNPEVEIWYGAQ